jgi:hypothetical protein
VRAGSTHPPATWLATDRLATAPPRARFGAGATGRRLPFIRIHGAVIYSLPEAGPEKVLEMSMTTNTRVNLEHPYRTAGIILVLLSFVMLAFSLGVLARCGHGEGLCFDTASHAAGDAGLAVFVIVFIIGIACMTYTGSIASFTTRTQPATAPVAAAPTVTNVYPQAAAPQPTVTNVYPQAAPVAPAATTVVVSPR